MKKIRIALGIAAVSLLFATISVYAGNYESYLGITLPILKGEVFVGNGNKTTTNVQSYLNSGTINSCTGNANTLAAKVKRGSVESDWLTISGTGQSGSWANNSKTTTTGSYELRLKNNTYSACTATHSGIWYHY